MDGSHVARPQSARLLALLLANANRPVPADLIEDALWDGEPADQGSLYTAISRLRSALPVGALTRGGSSYLLGVDPADYDVSQFEALLRAAAGSATEASLAIVAQAIALWRGRPFGAVADLGALASEVARLTDLHAAAHERHLELLLALGRGSDAASAAEAPLIDHPFHEGLRLLHARALSDCGRRVDALRTLNEFRRFLRDETGLDPSQRSWI